MARADQKMPKIKQILSRRVKYTTDKQCGQSNFATYRRTPLRLM